MNEVLQIQFRGIDEGADPKSHPAGTLLRADNCAMDKARRLRKRDGTNGLVKTRSDSGSIATGKRILSYPKGGLGLYDGLNVFNRVASTGSWTPIERVTPFSMTSRPFIDAERSIWATDFVISGELMLTVYLTGDLTSGGGSSPGRIYLRVDNVATGQCISLPKLIPVVSGYTKPRIVLGATDAFILYTTYPTGSDIHAVRVNLTTFALTAAVTLAANVGSTDYDAIIGTSSAGEALYIAYGANAGAARPRVISYTTAALAADQSYIVAGGGVTVQGICLCFCPLADLVGLTYSTGTGPAVYAIMLTVDLAVSTALTAVGYAAQADTVFIAEYDATHVVLGAEYRLATGGRPANFLVTGLADMATLTVPNATTRGTPRLRRATKPWSVSGRWYCAATVWVAGDGVTIDTIPQASVVVVEIEFTIGLSATSETNHTHMATLENLTGLYPIQSVQWKTHADSAGNVWVASSYRLREPFNEDDTIRTGTNVHKLVRYADDHMRTTPLMNGLFAAGAAPMWLDGAGAIPYGFQHQPKILTITPTAGGVMVVGTYTYVCCYVWVDSTGLVHRSLPSPPFTGTTAGANLWLKLLVAGVSISSKQQKGRLGNDVANPVMIEVYRTPVGGTTHYKLIDAFQINDPSTRSVTIDDLLADADVQPSGFSPLTAQPVVYTELSELGNIPPPACIACTTHRGRLVVLDSFKRGVWFSKDVTDDPKVAPGFNEQLYLGFASDKNSFGSLDDKLIVYGEHTIDIVHGAGPDATGNGEWQVQSLQTDVGCVNPKSVVTCPSGSVFLSQRGIELLSRDLTISWVGKVVQDTLATYPTITSAVLVSEEHEVRFTCNTANGANGIVLAWDYHHQIWFVRKYKDSADASTVSVAFVDAVLCDGVYTLLTAGGQVYQETDEHKLDNGTDYVTRDILLAPISPAGPMAWCRVKDLSVMGTGVTDHNMSVSFARDYATSFEQTKTFAATTPPVTVGPLTKCRVTFKNQQCRATQVRIQDIAPSAGTLGDGDGAIYEGLAIRYALKPGKVATTTPAEQG